MPAAGRAGRKKQAMANKTKTTLYAPPRDGQTATSGRATLHPLRFR